MLLVAVGALVAVAVQVANTPEAPAATPTPAIVVQAMEAGVLYCPLNTEIVTEPIINGYKVYCR